MHRNLYRLEVLSPLVKEWYGAFTYPTQDDRLYHCCWNHIAPTAIYNEKYRHWLTPEGLRIVKPFVKKLFRYGPPARALHISTDFPDHYIIYEDPHQIVLPVEAEQWCWKTYLGKNKSSI